MNGKEIKVEQSVSKGLGIFGWLIVLGCFGIGPCNSCMKGCGPTIDLPKVVEQHAVQETK